MLKLLTKSGLAILTTLAVVFLGLIFSNVWTYARLTAETDVALLAISRVDERSYLVDLETSEGRRVQFPIRGDAWQLDARLIKWRGWAQLLGRSPVYRLERLSGRYFDVESELSQERTVHALSRNPGIDIWSLARRHSRWVPGVDAAYGSSTYLPLADGASYTVTLSSTGLIARPNNSVAEQAIVQWR